MFCFRTADKSCSFVYYVSDLSFSSCEGFCREECVRRLLWEPGASPVVDLLYYLFNYMVYGDTGIVVGIVFWNGFLIGSFGDKYFDLLFWNTSVILLVDRENLFDNDLSIDGDRLTCFEDGLGDGD